MIGSLAGKVGEYVSIGDTVAEIVVDVAGVGYLVSVTTATASSTNGVGAEVKLAVHTHVRDGAITLYGFATPAERHAFELLLGAQGVGPALALAILGVHGPEDLAEIVANDDLASLTHVPGVGRKTAERLLVELRSRVADLTAAAGRSALSASRPQPSAGGERGELAEVRAALAALGYSPEEVRAALSDMPPEGSVEELLRAALRGLAPRR
jgi:Holliday junction DNA helicase RuvA